MADSDEKKDEIPAFKISQKKVDDSWKEEVRREREAAARAAAAQRPQAAPGAQTTPTAAPANEPRPQGSGPAAPANVAPKGTVSDAPAGEASAEKAQSPQEAQQTKIFLNFIDGLAQQALMQLGELENPYTGQAELDLQGARYTIELLSVISAKTKGNLTETEQKALTSVVQDLRTHFAAIAQEVQRQMQAQAAKGGAKRPGPGGTVR
ncbi:MAG TPA: DUF1844 domain-containing protein [Planctomycetota bacterium]|nr:DUF1844 domain-containing protein [Planctomycetota bacterium]